MAEQLGIENKDAESIIDSLIAQFPPRRVKTLKLPKIGLIRA